LAVAPHAGAWIETSFVICVFIVLYMSHLTRVRGLKQFSQMLIEIILSVAPHAGAWIET